MERVEPGLEVVPLKLAGAMEMKCSWNGGYIGRILDQSEGPGRVLLHLYKYRLEKPQELWAKKRGAVDDGTRTHALIEYSMAA